MADRRLPFWVKSLYTAFVAVMVPHYLRAYGPTNFLYFCDVAVLLALVAVWTEISLFASAPAVGILLPQALWMLDFVATLLGHPLTGMTEYMFNPAIPAFARMLSLFHFWLPLFLLWLVLRLGYDPRGFPAWCALAAVLLLVSYTLLPGPPAPAGTPGLPVNVNYVYGLSDARPQQWMDPRLYFAVIFFGLPTLIFWPTHRVLRACFRRADR
jgi:hypothetical protein